MLPFAIINNRRTVHRADFECSKSTSLSSWLRRQRNTRSSRPVDIQKTSGIYIPNIEYPFRSPEDTLTTATVQ